MAEKKGSAKGTVFLICCIILGAIIGLWIGGKYAQNIPQPKSIPAWKRLSSGDETCDAMACVVVDNASGNSQYGYGEIEGRALNNTGKDLSYMAVTFGIYNENGVKLNTCLANVSGLAYGETWQFSAPCTTWTANTKYKLESVEYF